MSAARPKGCVIFLNGFPGIGKLTIARTLQTKLGDVGSRLVDNHLIIDAAEAVHPGRSPEHKALRKQIRDAMFNDLKVLQGKDIVVILTGCLAANPEDVSVFAEHVAIAHSRGVPFYAFTMIVDKTEHLRRLQSQDRVDGKKCKMSDAAFLKGMMADHALLHPATEASIGSDVQGIDVHHKFMNTTHLNIDKSANLILDTIVQEDTGDEEQSEPK